MSRKNIILTDRLMRPIAHFSHAARVGSLVHVGAVAGVFPDLQLAGDQVGRIDVAAQVERMFDNLATTLSLMGAELADLVRVKTYIAFPRDVAIYARAFAARFAGIKIAHSVVGSWDFPLPQAAIELDAVAVIDGDARALQAPGQASVPGEAGGGVLCDGVHYATARPIDIDGQVGSHDGRQQAVATLRNLAAMLAAADLKPTDVCSLHLTLADLRERAVVDEELRRFFGDRLPACTFVGAPLAAADWRLTIETVAVKGGGRPIETRFAPLRAGVSAPAMLARDLLFIGGQHGLDQESAGDVAQQTRAAWERVHSLVDAAGFPADSILRTNNVLTDWRDYAGFNAGYGANVVAPYVPRATVLGQLSETRARVQVEAVAHRHGDAASILQVAPPRAAS
jgi:enamine deaminase RidA (YjgF/YER057c/UK114 family)